MKALLTHFERKSILVSLSRSEWILDGFCIITTTIIKTRQTRGVAQSNRWGQTTIFAGLRYLRGELVTNAEVSRQQNMLARVRRQDVTLHQLLLKHICFFQIPLFLSNRFVPLCVTQSHQDYFLAVKK